MFYSLCYLTPDLHKVDRCCRFMVSFIRAMSKIKSKYNCKSAYKLGIQIENDFSPLLWTQGEARHQIFYYKLLSFYF